MFALSRTARCSCGCFLWCFRGDAGQCQRGAQSFRRRGTSFPDDLTVLRGPTSTPSLIEVAPLSQFVLERWRRPFWGRHPSYRQPETEVERHRYSGLFGAQEPILLGAFLPQHRIPSGTPVRGIQWTASDSETGAKLSWGRVSIAAHSIE